MTLGLFELFYEPGQQPRLPAPFQPFDARGVNRTEYRELQAFRLFANSDTWAGFGRSGLFSPRFLDKMGIAIDDVVRFVAAHGDADVCLFHPYPRELSLANHFLELAELEHPGITDTLQWVWARIFDAPLPRMDASADASLCCHCNYVLGSTRFWQGYAPFVNAYMRLLDTPSGNPLQQPTPYTLTRTGDRTLPLGVFAFERALSHYLKQCGTGLKVVNYAFSGRSWQPPELFAGEAALVDRLLAGIRTPAASGEPEAQRRRQAVRHYFEHRRVAFQPG